MGLAYIKKTHVALEDNGRIRQVSIIPSGSKDRGVQKQRADQSQISQGRGRQLDGPARIGRSLTWI